MWGKDPSDTRDVPTREREGLMMRFRVDAKESPRRAALPLEENLVGIG